MPLFGVKCLAIFLTRTSAKRNMSGEGWLKKSGVLEKWKPLTDKKENASAKEFAEASLALISVFDLIPGMGMASGDMSKNATTILKAGEADPAKTLAALVDAELAGADPKKMGKIAGDGKTVSCALLWLGRALCFVIKLMGTVLGLKPRTSRGLPSPPPSPRLSLTSP